MHAPTDADRPKKRTQPQKRSMQQMEHTCITTNGTHVPYQHMCHTPNHTELARALVAHRLVTTRHWPMVGRKGLFIFGDLGFCIKDFLIIPFSDIEANTRNRRAFNYVLRSLRASIERAWGVMVGRFRRFQRAVFVPHEARPHAMCF